MHQHTVRAGEGVCSGPERPLKAPANLTLPAAGCSIPSSATTGTRRRERARHERAGTVGAGAEPPGAILPEPLPEPGAVTDRVRGRRRRDPPVNAAGRVGGRGAAMAVRPAQARWYRGEHPAPRPRTERTRRSACAEGIEDDVRAGGSEGPLPGDGGAGPRVVARGGRVPPLARRPARGARVALLRGPSHGERAAPASTTWSRAPSRTSTPATRR